MPRTPAETIPLHRRLAVAGGAIVAVACIAAAPAHAQAQSDTATSEKKDSTAAAPAKAASENAVQFRIGDGGNGGFQIMSGQMGRMVIQMGPATPGQNAEEPKIKTDADSTKTDSTKAESPAADSAKAPSK